MKYKVRFLGCPVGSLVRKEYILYVDCNHEPDDEVIVNAIYNGRNADRTKYFNVSWNSITVTRAK